MLVFGGLLAYVWLVTRAVETNNTILVEVLFYGAPVWILLIIFGSMYRRPRDR